MELVCDTVSQLCPGPRTAQPSLELAVLVVHMGSAVVCLHSVAVVAVLKAAWVVDMVRSIFFAQCIFWCVYPFHK